jgi:hypothetical protein
MSLWCEALQTPLEREPHTPKRRQAEQGSLQEVALG